MMDRRRVEFENQAYEVAVDDSEETVREFGEPATHVFFAGEDHPIPGGELRRRVLERFAAAVEGKRLYYAHDVSGSRAGGRTAFVWAATDTEAWKCCNDSWGLRGTAGDGCFRLWQAPAEAPPPWLAARMVPWGEVRCLEDGGEPLPPPPEPLGDDGMPLGIWVPGEGDLVALTRPVGTALAGDESAAELPAGTVCRVSSRRVLGAFQGFQFELEVARGRGLPLPPAGYVPFFVDEFDLDEGGRYPIRALAHGE